jgi:hypothetical protein
MIYQRTKDRDRDTSLIPLFSLFSLTGTNHDAQICKVRKYETATRWRMRAELALDELGLWRLNRVSPFEGFETRQIIGEIGL